ncbi:hypothetical protein [Moorena sp. SIO3I6]|uniref:hypothetical protein n=1 Tax=Moorena sp. SIO3I6 TaxID=2607831 RepID=UPI0025F5DF20|nr:hypothetical protein [Moorena sp. SIO3I6]
MAYWPRYANNLQPSTFNFKFSTFNLQPLTFNLQPWPIGHATRTTFNLQPSTFNLTTALQNKIAVIYRIAAAGGKTKLGFDPCP